MITRVSLGYQQAEEPMFRRKQREKGVVLFGVGDAAPAERICSSRTQPGWRLT